MAKSYFAEENIFKLLESDDEFHFLIEIVEKYEDGQQSSSTGKRHPSLTPKPSRLIERHFADYIPSDPSRANVTRRCKLCYLKGFKKETKFWCPDCGVTLCMPHCFKEYHTAK